MKGSNEFPKVLTSKNADGDHQWRQVPGFFARHGVKALHSFDDEVARIDDGVVICQETRETVSESSDSDDRRSPVYQRGPNGPVGVPTGLVFVRFEDDINFKDQSSQLQRLDFVIERASKDDCCGWVRHASGSMADTLTNVVKLHDLPGVVVVEPQLLMPRQAKSTRGPSPHARKKSE